MIELSGQRYLNPQLSSRILNNNGLSIPIDEEGKAFEQKLLANQVSLQREDLGHPLRKQSRKTTDKGGRSN